MRSRSLCRLAEGIPVRPLLLCFWGITLLAVAAAAPPAPAVVPPAKFFAPSEVRLLDGPFKTAMDLDGRYLLSLEPDRLLSGVRKNAGLEPKAPAYPGWESAGVASHTLGHYLSAVARYYGDTGDGRFLDRVNYLVDELVLCQKQDPAGYMSAIPDGKAQFDGLKQRGGKVLGWVPWYTMHKLFAGLRDAWLLCGNEKARTSLIQLADWADTVTRDLTEGEREVMLSTEHGGMLEVLSDVYALTGDPRHLETARRFRHRFVMDPLAHGEDRLTGLHANTQIPKMTGAARFYEVTGENYFHDVAYNFWNFVVTNRSYVIGGNSDEEHFFPPEQHRRHLTSATAETCNTYNMLKLTEHLAEWAPAGTWMDYYERALYNQILASQDPRTGMFTYFVPLKPGHFKLYSSPTNAFWCCVGTGMENHTRYTQTIYAHSADALWVNLFIPSTVNWKERGLQLRQETQFPESDTSRLSLSCQTPDPFTLKIRVPAWLAEPLSIRVNGRRFSAPVQAGYASIAREWRDQDRVEIRLPMALHTESLPHTPDIQAILYGPIVLAAELGTAGMEGLKLYQDDSNMNAYPGVSAPVTPVLIGQPEKIVRHIRKVSSSPLAFRTHGLVAPQDVSLIPFYRMHHQRYSVYFEQYSPAAWREHQEQEQRKAQQLAQLQARTVDQVQLGDPNSETAHHLKSERSRQGNHLGRAWRDADDGGFFEFTLRTAPGPMELRVTYWGSDAGNREFNLLVDGRPLATEKLNSNRPDEFFDRTYPLPSEWTSGHEQVTIRFQAKPANLAGGIFGLRLLRP